MNEPTLEPLAIKSDLGFEQRLLTDAQWEDLDPQAIALYRSLRARVRPEAEELQLADTEMLRALNLVKQQQRQWVPNVAGLLLLGKPLALRRLLPAVRVDYVRIAGTQWVEDPAQRFEATLVLREPLLRLIPRLEAAIAQDLPDPLRLEAGSGQHTGLPLLPQKVIREAVVNTLMHQDYGVHQPVLLVRYCDRMEIRNGGYSLKPEAMLGERGSKLRNPLVAAVLHELNFAETKGLGIRTMGRLLKQVGLGAPVFVNNVVDNQFLATYRLEPIVGEQQRLWLEQFGHLNLGSDETKALILAKETGAVDNAGLRAITGLDTLTASQLLARLHHQHHLLTQGGAGPATYYQLSQLKTEAVPPITQPAAQQAVTKPGNTTDLPAALCEKIATLTPKARKENLWPIIVWLCAVRPFNLEQLAQILNRQKQTLKASHLRPLRENNGLVCYIHPAVVNHPDQAYQSTHKGREWLKQLGIVFDEE